MNSWRAMISTRKPRFGGWARNPNIGPAAAGAAAPLSGTFQDSPRTTAAFRGFFREQLTNTDAPWYSHFIRWRNNRRTCRFLSEEIAHQTSLLSSGFLDQVPIPARFSRWGSLKSRVRSIRRFGESPVRAPFLLAKRSGCHGSLRGRAIPVSGLSRRRLLQPPSVEPQTARPERKILAQAVRKEVGPPEVIWKRPKRPYRAPIHRSFFNRASPEYVRDLCSPESLRETGLFKPAAVGQLVKRIQQGTPIGETDDMALAGIISSQLVFHHFVRDFRKSPPLNEHDDVKICGRNPVPQPT